jgi:predicted nucleotidyltransferase
MVPEKQIEEFVAKLRQAAGNNLESVILYGSAASGSFHPDLSDINLLCVLREISFGALQALAPVLKSWAEQKRTAPLLFSSEELQRSADVFAIEFMDMKEHHKVLFGSDPLPGLDVPPDRHRAQVEYELREKLILLRQRLVLSLNDENSMWTLLMQSLPAFTTLFRHALIALGDTPPKSKQATLQALATRISFDSSAFTKLLSLREKPEDRKSADVKDIVSRYLSAIQQVTAAVDKMLVESRSAS